MTAQGEKPCAIFVWAAEAYGAGGMNLSPAEQPSTDGSGRPRAGHARPLQRGALCRGGVPDAPQGGTYLPADRRAAYMPPLQSDKMFLLLNFIKFTLAKPNF